MIKNSFMQGLKGFSLLEMSCVLLIMSVLASAMAPVLTRSFLEKAGEKTSLDMAEIQEAARAYFIDNGSWPSSITVLQNGNYLPSAWNVLNPFGNVYSASINGSMFTVSTEVINGSQIAVISRLPVSSYSGNTVTSTLTPPGATTTGFGSATAISIGTIYKAATDGIVEVKATISTRGGGTEVRGYTDSSSNPSTFAGALSVIFPGSTQSDHTIPESSFSMSVKKGDYYELVRGPIINDGSTSDSASITASFRPLGT